MLAVDALCQSLGETQKFLAYYLGDLSDADLLVRPVEGANHIAWQIGHLIVTELSIGEQDPAFVYPKLPDGFAKQHSGESAQVNPPKGFASKETYLNLFNAARDATIAGVKKLTPEALDKPLKGDAAGWAPNLGFLLVLTSTHTMMHAGQFSVLRRKLGKSVLF